MLDLEPIAARLRAATPAEAWDREGGQCVWVGPDLKRMDRAADADLIAHAPADLTAMAAEVDKLRSLLHRAWDDLPEGCTVLRGQILTALGFRGCEWCGMICEGCEPAHAGS